MFRHERHGFLRCPTTAIAFFTWSTFPLGDKEEIINSIIRKIRKRKRLFEKLEALKLEGMLMKRKDSVYAFMRCRDWLKVRTSAGRMTIQKRIENWS